MSSTMSTELHTVLQLESPSQIEIMSLSRTSQMMTKWLMYPILTLTAHEHRGESRVSKPGTVKHFEDTKIIGGARLLRPSTYTQAKYHQPHRSGGASHQTSGRWEDNQGKHGIRTAGDNRRPWGEDGK